MVIWVDTPVKIYHKCRYKGFTKDYGDIPIMRYNNITNNWESVDNHRGYGYAKRKDIKYRKSDYRT